MTHDLRYAIRMLARNPGFTLAAVLALGLGIGANSAIFSVVNAALLRPLPYRDSSRLVMVWDQLTKLGLLQFPVTLANYFDYREQNQVFEDVAAFDYRNVNLTGTDQPERLVEMLASANLFPLLGAEAAAGRTFTREENQPGRDTVAVLSYALWQRRFGGQRSLIGRPILLDGNPITVIGVMAPGFRFSVGGPATPDVWMPLALTADPSRRLGRLRLIARLKPGRSAAEAGADLKGVAARIEQQYHPYRGPRGEDAGYGVQVVPLRDQLYGGVRQGLLVLLGAVGLVLLIACANVANLLLARAAQRGREIAIRTALGAGRGRLIRQLLTESVVLSLLGGGLGLVLAYWGVDLLVALAPGNLTLPEGIGLDPRVLGFTLALALSTGLLFGLVPALQVSASPHLRVPPSPRLRLSASSLLVGTEAALAMILLIGAGLLIRSFARLQNVNPGFRPERLLTAQISLPQSKYRENFQVAGFYQQLLERLQAVPEIQSAALVSRLPLSGGGRGGDPFSIEGRPYDASGRVPQVAVYQVASAGYFRTMQIPLVAGRAIEDRDRDGALPVAVINQTMARGFWPDQDPVGKRIVMGAPRPGVAWLTIVGVVADVQNASLDVVPIPQIYGSQLQNPSRSMIVVTRSAVDAAGLSSALRRQVAALDPDQPLYNVRTMEQQLTNAVSQPRFQTLLLGAFAGAALLLSALGIYGVVAHSVARRTHEIGIRVALGAAPARILRLVVIQGMAPVLSGLALGLAGSLALSRVLASLLYGVTSTDSPTFAAATLILASTALVACYLPARRAARVDPLAALRYE